MNFMKNRKFFPKSLVESKNGYTFATAIEKALLQ